MDSPIWKFESTLTSRLFLWAGISVLGGLWLWLTADEFGRAFGVQAVIWGLVDAAIAFWGVRSATLRSATTDPRKEALFIRRILWINFGLDFLYILGGIWLLSAWDSDFWQGTGWGIIVQGSFLFVFDLYHALQVPIEAA